ncbi:MAG: T9SS C-terminal target domain-containing protein, partial [Bacteroidetes bacterium]
SLIKEWNDDINTIILYDVSGRKAAEFIDKDNLDWLPNGLYIAEILWKERPSTRARVHITR